jgi:hypothetical protein
LLAAQERGAPCTAAAAVLGESLEQSLRRLADTVRV